MRHRHSTQFNQLTVQNPRPCSLRSPPIHRLRATTNILTSINPHYGPVSRHYVKVSKVPTVRMLYQPIIKRSASRILVMTHIDPKQNTTRMSRSHHQRSRYECRRLHVTSTQFDQLNFQHTRLCSLPSPPIHRPRSTTNTGD